MDTDVLIVGGGPTGLMLANQLARRGVRVMIVDRNSGPAQQTRAMAVHARSLEIYQKLGIAGRALELGRIGEAANMWANGRRRARIPLGDIGRSLSPFPFVLMLGQDDNERILGEHLRQWNVAVQWNTELVSFEETAGGVTATLERPGGATRTVTAAYLAGCDGGHSTVRDRLGIGFPGAPYEHVFFVADTEATGSMVPGELNVYLLREGFHLFFPMRGKDRWRVIGILPERLRGKHDLTFEETVPAIRSEADAHVQFRQCSWFSTYRIHHRRAERFRQGRCFLLGDAAHVHSPMGGQGMNTGLQDAYNLAWKLAHVVRGEADDALLDSYAAERMPVAQRLLQTTDRGFSLVVSDSWTAALFRTRIAARIAAFAMTIARVRRFAFLTLSQTGIHYRASPLSRALPGFPADAPQPGDRFPWLRLRLRAGAPVEDLFQALDDARWNLLVFGDPAAAPDLGDRVVSRGVPADPENARALARVRIPERAFFLLRPDGHIALAGTRLEAAVIVRYLSDAGMRP
jgi:2-polyprenyl-6-methoxyphenol hydroxylase-like FAD-dependent oxidoreductase